MKAPVRHLVRYDYLQIVKSEINSICIFMMCEPMDGGFLLPMMIFCCLKVSWNLSLSMTLLNASMNNLALILS